MDSTTSPSTQTDLASARTINAPWVVSLSTLVFCLVATEWAFRASGGETLFAASTLYSGKAQEFVGADILFTGDSRILHGFDSQLAAALMSREQGAAFTVYNAGLSGAPPMAQLPFIREALAAKRPPTLVLMGISPYMFSSLIGYAPSRESLYMTWRTQDIFSALRAGAGPDELAIILSHDLFRLIRFRSGILDSLLKVRATGQVHHEPTGVNGFLSFGPVSPEEQARRAHGRAGGYKKELGKPEAHLGNAQQGYFRESLRLLRAAGVKTLIVNTPSASQIDTAYGPLSLYAEHMAWVQATAREYGAQFVDARHLPGMVDTDFVDGDHLSGAGAAKFTGALVRDFILPALGGPQR